MTTDDLLTRGVEKVLPSPETLAKHIAEKKKIRVYLGIDPTGNSLHLGHAVVLRKLNQFAQAGHDVILLIGNGTVRIGDPTGRDSTRPVLTDAQIEENFLTWKEQASKVLDFSKITIKRNGDWLDKLSYSDIVKLMAQTTVQQLIERDMFQERLKKNLPIFGHEIMYPLLQGYDSVAMDVDLEIGGSDQTFNMLMGRSLQKAYNNHEKWVLTTPIINGTDGRKMGKSFGNFVGLTEPAMDMYGKLMSIADDLIVTYATLLTDLSQQEIEAIKSKINSGENPMNSKKHVAFAISASLHSPEDAQSAQDHFEKTVQHKEVPEDIQTLTIAKDASALLDVLVASGAAASKNDARRLIEQGAVSIDGEKLMNATQDMSTFSGSVLRIGKRVFFRLTTNY